MTAPMTYGERAFTFDCAGEALVAISAVPHTLASSIGLLVVVGGPQYRVGSHRQFVLLSRMLAENGIACLRFDYRSMGDAPGAERDFYAIDDDIRVAIDAFLAEVPELTGVVLWGICDAATAACFYAPRDPRVRGLVLLNPWVRTEAGVAKTFLKHHYLKRLTNPRFWKKLLAGGVAIGRAAREALAAVRSANPSGGAGVETTADLPTRTAAGVERSRVPFLVVLSGRDYVASEFTDVTRTHARWSKLLAAGRTERFDAADHTFSTAEWRDAVAGLTASWIKEIQSTSP